ncbi:hypothetical protein DIPPA_14908 [Diplonema papillatum]|nr:hypothetical protein DIPPA_14908 [Diplonema papillatum]|eukprot:gene3034-4767_t
MGQCHSAESKRRKKNPHIGKARALSPDKSKSVRPPSHCDECLCKLSRTVVKFDGRALCHVCYQSLVRNADGRIPRQPRSTVKLAYNYPATHHKDHKGKMLDNHNPGPAGADTTCYTSSLAAESIAAQSNTNYRQACGDNDYSTAHGQYADDGDDDYYDQ